MCCNEEGMITQYTFCHKIHVPYEIKCHNYMFVTISSELSTITQLFFINFFEFLFIRQILARFCLKNAKMYKSYPLIHNVFTSYPHQTFEKFSIKHFFTHKK